MVKTMNPYRRLYLHAMTVPDQEGADTLLEQLVRTHQMETGCPREEALEVQRSNLGYYAGYYDAETRARVERLFRCAHPFFGAIAEKGQPTAEEAFRLGLELGTKKGAE